MVPLGHPACDRDVGMHNGDVGLKGQNGRNTLHLSALWTLCVVIYYCLVGNLSLGLVIILSARGQSRPGGCLPVCHPLKEEKMNRRNPNLTQTVQRYADG